MKIQGQDEKHFILINKTADSLYSLIADGQHRATSLGRETWKSLLGSEGSLQLNCNMEGSMLLVHLHGVPKQELASLLTTKTIVIRAQTQESGLVLVESQFTRSHVVSPQHMGQIMVTSILRPWDISLCSDTTEMSISVTKSRFTASFPKVLGDFGCDATYQA